MKALSRVNALRTISTPIKFLELELARTLGRSSKCKKNAPRIFNLDLHISVIKDLQVGLEEFDCHLTNWSISRHNQVFRRFFVGPDPVKVINSGTWKNFDDDMRDQFLRIYGKYLQSFDAFIVTHTPVFHEIYKEFEKPILVVNSTRFEFPYTNKLGEWQSLNASLKERSNSGKTLIVSNNKSDAKYLNYFAGIESEVIPSIADYTHAKWRGGKGLKIFSDKRMSPATRDEIARKSNWLSQSEVFGSNFAWDDMVAVDAVFVIPYNVSTMQLFEFATAGIPVVVPSPSFLSKLYYESQALQELSFYQIEKLPTNNLSEGDPNNFNGEDFLKFWLEHADFYDTFLMPNVLQVDSFEDLKTLRLPHSEHQYLQTVALRNDYFKSLRTKLLRDFLGRI